MWATGSEISHGKIRTYGKGSGGNNTIIYDQQLVVYLENKAHSVTLLCSSSLVLCNFKAYPLTFESIVFGMNQTQHEFQSILKTQQIWCRFFYSSYSSEPYSKPAQSCCLCCLE